MYGPDGHQHYWPWAIKPVTGTVEVVFQNLATRPPFDDTAVRDELRERVNRVPGVQLPASRLTLRPSFPVELIVGADAFAAAADAHAHAEVAAWWGASRLRPARHRVWCHWMNEQDYQLVEDRRNYARLAKPNR